MRIQKVICALFQLNRDLKDLKLDTICQEKTTGTKHILLNFFFCQIHSRGRISNAKFNVGKA